MIKKLAGFALALGLLMPSLAGAQMSSAEQINALLQQIAALQQQLIALQSQTTTNTNPATTPAPQAWCHTFNVNMGVGATGTEVSELGMALGIEGAASTGGSAKGFYDEALASAVTAFQEKYRAEILTPNGLKNGNGFVGRSTRAKLNALYGCKLDQTSKLKLLSPLGGQLLRNSVQIFQWQRPNPTQGEFALSITSKNSGTEYRISPIIGGASYQWTVGTVISSGKGDATSVPDGDYFLKICEVGMQTSRANQCDVSTVALSISSVGPISGSPTINSVSGPALLKVGETGTWAVSASDTMGGTLYYNVQWGDSAGTDELSLAGGGRNFAQTATFTHAYNMPGEYTATFWVKNQSGQVGKWSLTVKVSDTIVSNETVLNRYSYQNGEFIQYQTPAGIFWRETSKLGSHIFNFVQYDSNATYYFLRDASRNMVIEIPVNGGVSWWSIDGTNSWIQLYYLTRAGALSLSSSGESGMPGSTVTIWGSGFTQSLFVYLNGNFIAEAKVVSDTQATFVMPKPFLPNTYTMTVRNDKGESNAQKFTVLQVIVGAGQLSVSLHASSPAAATVAPGASASVLTVTARALNEAIALKKVGVVVNSATSNLVENVEVWSGGVKVGQGTFVGSKAQIVLSSDVVVPKDSENVLAFKAKVAGSATPGSVFSLSMDPTEVSGVGQSSGTVLTAQGSAQGYNFTVLTAGDSTAASRDAKRINDVSKIAIALYLYADAHVGNHPTSLSALVPQYMISIPVDPGSLVQSGGGAYYYVANGKQYHLGTDLELASSMPSKDMNCDSTASNSASCFNPALSGGFVGSIASRYDLASTLSAPPLGETVLARYTYANGEFVQYQNSTGIHWRETLRNPAGVVFNFDQTKASTDKNYYIYDASRNMTIEIPINGGFSRWSVGSGAWNSLYYLAKDGVMPSINVTFPNTEGIVARFGDTLPVIRWDYKGPEAYVSFYLQSVSPETYGQYCGLGVAKATAGSVQVLTPLYEGFQCRRGSLGVIKAGQYKIALYVTNDSMGASDETAFTKDLSEVPFTIAPAVANLAITTRGDLGGVLVNPATPYAISLQATGGSESYTWALVSGQVPPGMSLVPAVCVTSPCQAPATLSGSPTVAGVYNFEVVVTSGSQKVSRMFSLTVNPPSTAPSITLSVMPTTVASGGTATLSWKGQNLNFCVGATGPWGNTSNKALPSGTEVSKPLTARTAFQISCQGTSGVWTNAWVAVDVR